MALFLLAGRSTLHRRQSSPPGAALLLCLVAQLSALLLTWLSGAAEIFPSRMLLALFFTSALGGVIFEKSKKRGAVLHGLRIALYVYMLSAALAGMEQAFLN